MEFTIQPPRQSERLPIRMFTEMERPISPVLKKSNFVVSPPMKQHTYDDDDNQELTKLTNKMVYS